MATKRCIPTTFFEDADVVELGKHEQLILIGLVLDADDSGRGLTKSRLLGRKLDFEPEQIEQAFATLERYDFIQCYEVGRHRYYSLCRWQEWQSLNKPTPSRYPAPPQKPLPAPEVSQHSPVFPTNPLGNCGESGDIPQEEEGEREKEREVRIKKGEGGEETPSNVVVFPTTGSSDGTSDARSEQHREEATKQAATILKLTISAALARVVGDYIADPTLSLLGEADAAREWIDDPRRNRKGQRMTPAFFRRWLKREHEDFLQRKAQRHLQATGTTGKGAVVPDPGTRTGKVEPPASNTTGVDPYQAFVMQRTRELYARSSPPDALRGTAT